MSLSAVDVVAVTLAPASPAVACLVQARPRVTPPFLFWSTVQPLGPLSVPLRELTVRKTTRVSPACTLAGIWTVWLVRLAAVLAEPTYESAPVVGAAVGETVRVVWAVVVPSPTVRVTVLVPVDGVGAEAVTPLPFVPSPKFQV